MFFSDSCSYRNLNKGLGDIEFDEICVSEVINVSKSDEDLCFIVYAKLDSDCNSKPGARCVGKKISIDLSGEFVVIDGDIVCKLARVEARVFGELLKSRGEPVSRDTLHQYLYNQERGPFCRRIDNLISSIRKKIEKNKLYPEVIKTVRFKGYVIN